MDILSLLALPFKLIWTVLAFPFKLVLTTLGFVTHLTWGVVIFPIKVVLALIGTVAHGLIGTFTALILFIVSPFGLFSPQPPIAPSPTLSASASSPQTVFTNAGSDTLRKHEVTLPQTVFINASSDNLRKHEVTLETYTQIKPGMSYEEVKEIIGDGIELQRSGIGEYEIVLYQWKGKGFMTSMNAMFQNDSLISKAQLGLK